MNLHSLLQFLGKRIMQLVHKIFVKDVLIDIDNDGKVDITIHHDGDTERK